MENIGLTIFDKEWRYNRIRKFLEAKGLKAMLVCAEARREANIRYFTGQYHKIVMGINYVLFPVNGDPILFAATPQREFNLLNYTAHIEDHWVKDARILSIENIVKAFEELNLTMSSIGVTLSFIPAIDYLVLSKRFPHIEFIDISGDFANLRRIKSEGEINLARESARIVDCCWERVANEVKPGMYEHEVIAIIEDTMWKLDTDKTFNLTNCSSADVSRPCFPSAHFPRVLKMGDILLAEITACYGGYYTQKVSLFSMGKPSSLSQKLFDTCELAHQKAVQMISPGVNAKEIISMIDDTVQKTGFLSSSQFPTGPHGHLTGLDTDEGTFLPGKNFILEEGMVLAIHPGGAVPGWAPGNLAMFGPGSCYVVTSTGVESLNHTPNHLVVIN